MKVEIASLPPILIVREKDEIDPLETIFIFRRTYAKNRRFSDLSVKSILTLKIRVIALRKRRLQLRGVWSGESYKLQKLRRTLHFSREIFRIERTKRRRSLVQVQ